MKEVKSKKKRIIIVILVLIILIGLSIGSYFLYDYITKEINGEEKYLSLELVGEDEITLNYKDKYEDKGSIAKYKDKDITEDIEVNNNLDMEKLGTYFYKYKIKYKKQVKELTRKITIVDKEKPKLTLNGNKELTITIGDKYKELGAKAADNYDKDLTKKIKIDSRKLNIKKVGTYKVTYTVKDSSNNESKIERTVKVKDKIKNVKPKESVIASSASSSIGMVPVLNYHFFYEKKSEGCDEDLCLRMDKFREQLAYLKNNGYKTLTIEEFVNWMYGKIEVPKKSVLITIDDGAHGTSKINGNHLIPALEKYKMHATLFLITGWWDIKNYKSSYLDIQSHTNNLHYAGTCGYRSKVNCVSYNDLLADLKKSIKVVNSSLSFCFPFYNYSDTSIKAVKDAGFKVAFIGGNRKATRNDNKYKIPRYPIHDSTTMKDFKAMVN